MDKSLVLAVLRFIAEVLVFFVLFGMLYMLYITRPI